MAQLSQLGRLFMVGIPGKELDKSTIGLIETYGINNFIIFRRNIDTPAQLEKLCADIRQTCLDSKLPAPLLAIDQEGGTVARLPPPFTQFDDARRLAGAADPLSAVRNYARTCVKELKQIGINMNLAPVLDVCPEGEGFFMEKRSLGDNPQVVSSLACEVINTFQSGGVAACGKHFPGLGAAKLDPHMQLPLVTRSMEQMRKIDLFPFQRAVAAGIAAIMTSHTLYKDWDAHTPATLSKRILTDLLRTEMGFTGLLITDDLEMGAIENERTVPTAALMAFSAGADVILICHQHDKVRLTYDLMRTAFSAEQIPTQRFDESLARVDAVQRRFT